MILIEERATLDFASGCFPHEVILPFHQSITLVHDDLRRRIDSGQTPGQENCSLLAVAHYMRASETLF